MRAVILGVSSRDKSNKRFLDALKKKPQGTYISFETPQLLFKVLSNNRWDLLNVMTGAGPISIREASRRLGRDVKAVHGDVHKLLNVGILQKTDKGKIEFPFDTVHVDFIMSWSYQLLIPLERKNLKKIIIATPIPPIRYSAVSPIPLPIKRKAAIPTTNSSNNGDRSISSP